MTGTSQEDAQARLLRLRDAGAISAEDYQRLTRAVTQPRAASPGPSRAGAMLQTAGSIAAGVMVGSLAADVVRNALSEPSAEEWEYSSTTETTYTEDGYITETSESWEQSDGATDASDVGGADADLGDLEI